MASTARSTDTGQEVKKNGKPYRKKVTEGEKLNSFKVLRYEAGKYETCTNLLGLLIDFNAELKLGLVPESFCLGSSHAPNRPMFDLNRVL